jgi:ATP-binding protein involved in chromosome partitioning
MYDALLGIKDVACVIMVSSGKGGVGKSTVAANLASALHVSGATVGILDADIYGPSQAMMFGVDNNQQPLIDADLCNLSPHQTAQGIRFMSIATRIPPDQSLNWKGSMVTMVLHQLIFQTNWGKLDYLVIDMPPGTGDVQIYMADKLKHATAVVVTTPQSVSVIDCLKGVDLLIRNKIQVLGVVENMSHHVCACCGAQSQIFVGQGGQQLADKYQIPMLAQIPMVGDLATHADGGIPTVLADPHGAIAQAYMTLSSKIREITNATQSHGQADPC